MIYNLHTQMFQDQYWTFGFCVVWKLDRKWTNKNAKNAHFFPSSQPHLQQMYIKRHYYQHKNFKHVSKVHKVEEVMLLKNIFFFYKKMVKSFACPKIISVFSTVKAIYVYRGSCYHHHLANAATSLFIFSWLWHKKNQAKILDLYKIKR